MLGQTAVNGPCRRQDTDDNVCPLNSLANHVPSVEALKPGVLEVLEGAGESKKWFGAYFVSDLPAYEPTTPKETQKLTL